MLSGIYYFSQCRQKILPNRETLPVMTAGIQSIESVLFDNMINDNGCDGGPGCIRTVSFTATDASGNWRLCKM